MGAGDHLIHGPAVLKSGTDVPSLRRQCLDPCQGPQKFREGVGGREAVSRGVPFWLLRDNIEELPVDQSLYADRTNMLLR